MERTGIICPMLISKKDLNFLQLAKEAALSSECRWRLGSVLIFGGAVMAISPNKVRHHPRWMQVYTTHAEHAVVSLARDKAKGATVYVVRVGAKGDLRNSKPCEECLKMLYNSGVNRVVWSNTGGEFESARLRTLLEEAY